LIEASESLARVQAAHLTPNFSLEHLPPLLKSIPSPPQLPQGLLDSPSLPLSNDISVSWFSHSDYAFTKQNLTTDSWKIILAHEFFDALPIFKFKSS